LEELGARLGATEQDITLSQWKYEEYEDYQDRFINGLLPSILLSLR
jgi:hypothetical protein